MYKIQAIKHLPATTWQLLSLKSNAIDNIINEYKNWCTECVGVDNWNYDSDKRVPHEFRFKDEMDLLAFKLKFNL